MIDRYHEHTEEKSKEEELKRADHLLYVTLKYTRTVDVMKNIIKRLISAIDFAVEDALVKRGILINNVALVRFKQLEKEIKGVKDYAKFYILLKKIDKSKFTAREEYRKNVTLILPDMEIKVDNLKEYFEKTKEFVKLVG